MQTHLDSLIQLLTRQAEIYEELLALAREKKDMIIRNDIDALRRATARENTLVGGYRKTERIRESLICAMAGELHKSSAEITLSDVIDWIDNHEKKSAAEKLKHRLRAAADALKPANEHNKALIDHSLEYIAFTMNIIRDAYSGPSWYTAQGEEISGGTGFIDMRR